MHSRPSARRYPAGRAAAALLPGPRASARATATPNAVTTPSFARLAARSQPVVAPGRAPEPAHIPHRTARFCKHTGHGISSRGYPARTTPLPEQSPQRRRPNPPQRGHGRRARGRTKRPRRLRERDSAAERRAVAVMVMPVRRPASAAGPTRCARSGVVARSPRSGREGKEAAKGMLQADTAIAMPRTRRTRTGRDRAAWRYGRRAWVGASGYQAGSDRKTVCGTKMPVPAKALQTPPELARNAPPVVSALPASLFCGSQPTLRNDAQGHRSRRAYDNREIGGQILRPCRGRCPAAFFFV